MVDGPRCSTASGGPSTSSCAARHTRSRCARTGRHRFRVSIAANGDEHVVDADLDRLDRYASRLRIAGRSHRLITATHGPVHLIEVDGVTHRVSRDEGGVLRSPAPALVVATPVAVGDEVAAGAPVLVLESMKMETVLPAPFRARVRELRVSAGSQVETGAPLLRLEPVGDADEAVEEAPGASVELDLDGHAPAETTAAERAARGRADLCAMVLGYDIDPRDEGRTLQSYLAARDELVAAGTSPVADEVKALGVFADFAELSRNRPAGEERHIEHRVHSPKRALPHLPAEPRRRARGAFPTSSGASWPGCWRTTASTELDRTPELEEAVFRVFLAQQRSAPDVVLATTLLQRWLTEPCPEPPADQAARDVLDRLVRRHPAALPRRGRPRPQRAVPVVRPAARRRRAGLRARRGGRRDRRPRSRPRGAGLRGPDRRARRHPRADRAASSRSVWSTACPSGSRCSRCSSSATTATTSCTR